MEAVSQNKPKIEVVDSAENLAKRSVELFVACANKAIQNKGVFYVAISGGHTPGDFYELLGSPEHSANIEWDKVQIFWVDERYVPIDSILSNYKLAADAFLDKVPIPEQNVHKIPTEYSDLSQAAHKYEHTIRNVFNLQEKQRPVFDLIILGMGADGHTGSLFPNSYAPIDIEDLACAVYVLDNDAARITLTPPVLTNAMQLIVLVSGKEKAQIVKKVFSAEPDDVCLPIHTLWPVLDKITWLIDNDAAELIK